uniref:ECRG4 augurin precursor a n=1 Tax=Cyprinus carpio carpio TaxID=630221 RepID=A0A8C0YKQ1_CYPCA
MVSEKFYLRLLTFVTLLTVLALSDVASENTLEKLLMKKVDGDVKPAAAVAVTPSRAKQFLASLKRPKRNLWDRSRPDVQQWIQQFMYMGFDEARLETDLAYWMDHYQSSDQGRQHHYDENSPMGPRSAGSYRDTRPFTRSLEKKETTKPEYVASRQSTGKEQCRHDDFI